MANLMTEARAAMPMSMVAGDSLRVLRGDLGANYPAADGYAVSFVFVPVKGGTAITVAATDITEGWTLSLASAVTAEWQPGEWRWAVKVANGADRMTADSGTIRVQPDPAAATDTRSHARRVLDSLEAAIEGRATQTDLENTLADGRQIRRMSHKELLDMRDAYARKVAAEDRRKGRGGPSRILVSL